MSLWRCMGVLEVWLKNNVEADAGQAFCESSDLKDCTRPLVPGYGYHEERKGMFQLCRSTDH